MEEFIYEIQHGNASVVKYTGPGGRVTIPSRTPGGKPVRVIGRNAFGLCKSLEAVIIPENVESIEEDAFGGCENLSEVKFPETLRHIGSYAFCSCSALKTVVIPDGVHELDEFAFAQCYDLIRVKMPESLSSVSDCLFAHCGRLHDLILPEGITSIGSCAFGNCRSLESLRLPEGISAVGRDAFLGCGRLEIILPNSIREVLARDCNGVRGIQVREDHPTLASIDGVLFSRDLHTLNLYPNREETGYTVPDGVKAIGEGAFRGNTALTHLSLPTSLEQIGSRAFWSCTGLTEIVIPESVRSIGSGAFYGCTALKNMRLPEGVLSIGGSAFSGCTALKNVRLPESLTEIGGSSFQSCYQAVFTVPEHSCALAYCRENHLPYQYPGREEVLPAMADDPQGYVRTRLNQLNMYLLTRMRCFAGMNSVWDADLFEYSLPAEDIDGESADPEKRIDVFFNCILHSDNAPFQWPDEPLREMKEYILTVLKETGAEIHEFTPEGERRFDREHEDPARDDAFLIHAADLWFVLDLTWSD